MKYYNYAYKGIMTEYVAPVSNYLLWEIDADNDKLLCVPLIGSIDEVHSTENGGLDWTKEIDRGNSGFLVGWHDRANEKIYLIEHPAAGNVTTGFIDYSTWAAITWTSHNGDLGVDLASEGGDIFIRDGNIEAIVSSGAQLDARRYNNPWASIDIQADAITYIGMGVVIGTVYYFWGDEAAANTINMYKFDGAIITPLDTIAATSRPTGIGTLGGNSMAYDGSDVIYFTCKDDGTGDLYLYSYSITGDAITKLGFFDIVLMADRNTAAGYKEKGYNTTGNDIYQLHESIPYQLHKIAVPAFASGFNSFAMTDNFLFSIDGTPELEVWKYEDQLSLILSLYIDHQVEEASHCIFKVTKDDIIIEKNMLIRFYHNYTTAGSTSEEIVFEGIIVNFDELKRQTVWCMSSAKRELKDVKPEGDYTKDSDGLISQLIIDYCNYITEGTLTDGADLGTIALGGNLNLETILDDCAEFEAWIWYLDPTGKLYFNNGTTDSTINYSQNDGLTRVRPSYVHEEFNKIKVRGAYVDGVQIESDWQEDLESQQLIGINEKIIDVAFLNTVALCNIAAANLLTILAKDPKKVTFSIRDIIAGLILPGETITFEYNNLGIVIASDQFLIRSAVLDKNGLITYTIVDELT